MKQNFEVKQRLEDGTKSLGLELTFIQIQQMLELMQLLVQWGQVYNLTAVREPLEMVGQHILDSLALLPYLKEHPVLDMGTGAGFPGLPLAIMRPNWAFTLLDSNGKKVRFVRQALLELGLHNVQAVQSRIETYNHEGKFATIVARALAPLPQLLRWVMPLLQSPGVLLAPKGQQVQAELAAVDPAIMALGQVQVHQLQVPYVAGIRPLVEIHFS